MINKLTLRDRIFVISSILILVAIGLIWIFIKPRYENTVVKERTTIVSQLQEYTLRQTDNTIRNWLNSTARLAEDLTASPENTPELANKAINYTPGLMRVLISDTESDEEIDLTRGIYTSIEFPEEDLNWVTSRLDATISVTLDRNNSDNIDFFIAEKAFQIGNNVFRLRLFFNSQTLNNNLLEIPLSGEYHSTITNPNAQSIYQDSEFVFPGDLIGETSFSKQRVLTINDKNWYVLSSRFETVPYWHLIAINELFILEPVNQLLLFTYITAAIILALMLVFSWYVSLRINKPIKLLLEDVDHLSQLDFDHRIKQVSLPEFQPMHDTLEHIRTTLQRYQKLNVEKIILEEWKNRYMVTYSDDFIGIIGEEGTFNFINNQLNQFLEELQLNPKNTNLQKILNHPDIVISDSNQSIHYPDPFTVKVDQAEIKHTNREGSDYFYHYQYLSILDENNASIGAYVIIHDKTEDRLLDIKRNDMINVIVHELKNPITGVVGLSKLIIDSDSMSLDEAKVLTKEVFHSGERMNDLVNRFLDVQKLESGTTSLNISSVDIRKLLSEVTKLSKPLLSSKDLTLMITEKGTKFTLEADYDLIFDAIQNLLSNAVKYGDPGREIRIDCVSTQENLSIAITDFGYGISIEDQNKVFDKFFRVKSNPKSAKEKGTGLGLAYVKEIMQRHKGEISLESSPKIGTKFTLIFPRIFSDKV